MKLKSIGEEAAGKNSNPKLAEAARDNAIRKALGLEPKFANPTTRKQPIKRSDDG